MVVQCPNCQSKFRIADEKVTDRGVRVRCTSCKSVFQVKRSGATEVKKTEPQGVTGTTQEMQAVNPALLGGAAPARPGLARPAQKSAPPPPPPPMDAGSTAIFALPTAAPPTPLSRPPGKAPPARPAAAPAGNGRPRLQADDLFGMSELTGDVSVSTTSPLSSKHDLPIAKPAARPAGKPPGQRPPGKPAPAGKPSTRSADDFDAALEAAVGNAPPVPPTTVDTPPVPPAARPPARPAARPPPPPPPVDDFAAAPPPPPPAEPPPQESQLRDPFEGVDLNTSGEQSDAPVELGASAKAAAEKAAEQKPAPISVPPPEFAQPRAARREAVGSALTGLVGAALALIVVLAGALSDGNGTGWLGLGTGSDVVATRVVSGLYETASGRLVFFVRGRVVNKGTKARGPVRVVAELVSDQGTEARSETLAGMEPTPEEVYSLKSTNEAEKLVRTLARNDGERRIPPGGSLPFFTLIPDPPTHLNRHTLEVHLETMDAWSGAPSAAANKNEPAKTEAPKAEAPKEAAPPAPKPAPGRPGTK